MLTAVIGHLGSSMVAANSVAQVVRQDVYKRQGYEFLRNVIAEKDYKARSCQINADEIFISDGAKSDAGNIFEIFSADNTVLVTEPVYPLYVDSNIMAGRKIL